MAIIAHDQVKMAHLAIVGSFSVNGVAELHTEILKKREMNDFYQVFPEKFNNKTNGITHRRWLFKVKSRAFHSYNRSRLVHHWMPSRTERLQELLKFQDDSSFLEQLRRIKQGNKEKLAKDIQAQTGIDD